MLLRKGKEGADFLCSYCDGVGRQEHEMFYAVKSTYVFRKDLVQKLGYLWSNPAYLPSQWH